MSEVFWISSIYVCTVLVHRAICPQPLILQHSSLSIFVFNTYVVVLEIIPFLAVSQLNDGFKNYLGNCQASPLFSPSYKGLRRIISKWGGGNILFLCLLISTLTLEAMATKYFFSSFLLFNPCCCFLSIKFCFNIEAISSHAAFFIDPL